MAVEELAKTITNLQKAYILISQATNLPYVECEEENYNDQIYLFESKEEAEQAVEDYAKTEIRVRVLELKLVDMMIPEKANQPNGPKKKMTLNQVRQQLVTLPYMGINAVGYKAAGKDIVTVALVDLLPEDYEKKISQNPLYQPNLQLTGIYLMQQARRKKEFVDRKQLVELDEEFGSNLVKSRLFIAVTPKPGHEKDQKLDLRECQLPFLRHPNGDCFFPVFTDIWECQKYTKNNQNFRPIQVPFAELQKFWVQEAKAYMFNPMGFSLPMTREQVPMILQKFGVDKNPS